MHILLGCAASAAGIHFIALSFDASAGSDPLRGVLLFWLVNSWRALGESQERQVARRRPAIADRAPFALDEAAHGFKVVQVGRAGTRRDAERRRETRLAAVEVERARRDADRGAHLDPGEHGRSPSTNYNQPS